MSCITAWHNAIKEVYATIYCLNNILGSTYAHKVAWLINRHVRLDNLDNVIHNISRLANRKTAYCVAVTLDLTDSFHILYTEIIVGAALIYTEEKLIFVNRSLKGIETIHLCSAALEPSYRTFVRSLDVFIRRRILNTLVKRHCDGRAEVGLNLN